MSDLDKTIKIRAYSGGEPNDNSQNKPKEDPKTSTELLIKTPKSEEDQSKFVEFAKVIEQLGRSLKEEQSKSAELTKKLGTLEEVQTQSARLARRVSELEEEQKKSLETSRKTAELEARIKELAEALEKISSIAAAAAQKKTS